MEPLQALSLARLSESSVADCLTWYFGSVVLCRQIERSNGFLRSICARIARLGCSVFSCLDYSVCKICLVWGAACELGLQVHLVEVLNLLTGQSNRVYLLGLGISPRPCVCPRWGQQGFLGLFLPKLMDYIYSLAGGVFRNCIITSCLWLQAPRGGVDMDKSFHCFPFKVNGQKISVLLHWHDSPSILLGVLTRIWLYVGFSEEKHILGIFSLSWFVKRKGCSCLASVISFNSVILCKMNSLILSHCWLIKE